MTVLDDFKKFVTDEQGASGYKTWARDNCGKTRGGTPDNPASGTEVAKWFAFRDAILAGNIPSPPVMSTSQAKALVDAGMEYLDSLPAPPVPPPVPPDPSTPTPQPGYAFGAWEGERYSFAGMRDVIYGANGVFTAPRLFIDGVDCNNTVFGDPAVGVKKHCEGKIVTTPVCVTKPKLTGSTIVGSILSVIPGVWR